MSSGRAQAPCFAVATATQRSVPGECQDAAAVVPGRGVIVADGVGSLPASRAAAHLAVETFVAATPARAPGAGSLDPAVAWVGAAHERILGDLDGAGATTALTAIAGVDVVRVDWVGNGAALRLVLAPERTGSATAPHLLVQDLVLPHVGHEHGRDVLERVLGIPGPAPVPDSVVVGHGSRPSLLLLVTDGVHSVEQLDVGTTSDGGRWIRIPPVLDRLVALAGELLAGAVTEPELHGRLGSLLADLAREGSLTDDAAVGAVLLPGDIRRDSAPAPEPKSVAVAGAVR